jgi:hypothetical protein
MPTKPKTFQNLLDEKIANANALWVQMCEAIHTTDPFWVADHLFAYRHGIDQDHHQIIKDIYAQCADTSEFYETMTASGLDPDAQAVLPAMCPGSYKLFKGPILDVLCVAQVA